MARNIPNIITLSRMLFAAMLLVIPCNSIVFLCLYLCCALSDILDGYIARRYNLTSKTGAKLDSLADGVLAAVMVILLFRKDLLLPYAGLIITVVLIRLINLMATRVKFKQWGMLHTLGNKAAGFMAFLAVPYYYCMRSLPHPAEVILWTLAIASSLEETLIIMTSSTYNSDDKGLVWRMMQK
jgi:CDP-diacylglycerol--glycerol-3-phosphate 3-phosphatidyltransferase